MHAAGYHQRIVAPARRDLWFHLKAGEYAAGLGNVEGLLVHFQDGIAELS